MSIADITSAVSQVVSMIGSVVTGFFGTDGAMAALTPILILAFAITCTKMAWGLIVGLFRGRGRRRR